MKKISINSQSGFTLIELLMVVIIIGVLATIAVPNYQRHVINTQKSAMQAKMMEIAGILENHYSQKGAYFSDFVGALNDNAMYTSFPSKQKKRYTLQIILIDSDDVELMPTALDDSLPYQRYLIRAIPTKFGNQQTNRCGTLTLNNFQIKGADADNCW